jgi:ABC-2 type transport system ATP-binding protein
MLVHGTKRVRVDRVRRRLRPPSRLAIAAPSTVAAVEVRELVKRYPRAAVNAVDGISFQVQPGEVFGLLGPNGAGKTTTIGVLTTRVRATSGRAAVAGADVVREPVVARSRLAVVPQRSNLDRSLTIRDNLIFHAAYHGVAARERRERADALLDWFGLLGRAKSKPDQFSGGQEQRVMIARALMHQPKVLFLDEPSTGLDPAVRLFVWDRLRELAHHGVALVLTTHDMHEAAALADRVAIIDRGRLLAVDTPGNLVRSLPGAATLEIGIDSQSGRASGRLEHLKMMLARLSGVEAVEHVAHQPLQQGDDGEPDRSDRLRLYVTGRPPMLVAPAATVLAEHGAVLTDVRLGEPSLEDVFIHLTGRALR